MGTAGFEWLLLAADLEGPGFACFQRGLAKFNHDRLEPSLPGGCTEDDLHDECRVRTAEVAFVEAMRRNGKKKSLLIIDFVWTREIRADKRSL